MSQWSSNTFNELGVERSRWAALGCPNTVGKKQSGDGLSGRVRAGIEEQSSNGGSTLTEVWFLRPSYTAIGRGPLTIGQLDHSPWPTGQMEQQVRV